MATAEPLIEKEVEIVDLTQENIDEYIESNLPEKANEYVELKN